MPRLRQSLARRIEKEGWPLLLLAAGPVATLRSVTIRKRIAGWLRREYPDQ